MKKQRIIYSVLLVLLLGYIVPSIAQKSTIKPVVQTKNTDVATDKEEYRIQPNRNFAKGEQLSYLAHYGFLNMGKCTVKLDDKLQQRNNRSCYQVDIDAKTVGIFALGSKIKDKWRSYIDTKAIMPHEFYRDIHENSYTLIETAYFNQKEGKIKVNATKRGEAAVHQYDQIPAYTQDMVSGYYYLRTLSFEKMTAGDIIEIDIFFEDKVYDMKIRFEGREVVKTKFGKVNSFILRPIMPDNKLFSGEDAIKVWISDDENRVPLKIDVDLVVGTFEIEISEHSGLSKDFNWAK